jgi:DNA repair exonuclease SbcCD ATPase subunit
MINFETLRYQNILSTGNQFTEIQLNRAQSTLIMGENGAGKSTVLESLTYALYGKPFRNINKPQIINSITNKNLLVEVDFSVSNKKYMIRRGMKPNIFEIYQDGIMLNQNAGIRDDQEYLEKSILKMNFKTFSQIVVLGSANYMPFMQLPAAQRRGVVEDLLDIQIFSIMNSILKDKISDNKYEMRETDQQISLCDQKIKLHNKHLDSLKANNEELIEEKRKKIADYDSLIVTASNEVDLLLIQTDELNDIVSGLNKFDQRKNKLVSMESALEDKVRKLNKEIQFFHDHDNCPTCKQGIDHEFKISTIDSRKSKTEEVKDALHKIELEINITNAKLKEINEYNEQIGELNKRISENNQQIGFYQRYINELNDEIQTLHTQTQKIHKESEDSANYIKELKLYKKKSEALSNQKSVYEMAAHLLKDTGIKTKIIKQYVPVMNKLINKYLAQMNFMCEFQLDETFNETIKSRFRDVFTYASFSEGEKARIDLALMMTWRAVAKIRNSASTNLLIMDEVVDGAVDSEAQDALMEMIESLTDSNVFIISHSERMQDKFDNVIKFAKVGNFSRIVN